MVQSTKMRFKMNLPSSSLSALLSLLVIGNLSVAVKSKAVIIIVIVQMYFAFECDAKYYFELFCSLKSTMHLC